MGSYWLWGLSWRTSCRNSKYGICLATQLESSLHRTNTIVTATRSGLWSGIQKMNLLSGVDWTLYRLHPGILGRITLKFLFLFFSGTLSGNVYIHKCSISLKILKKLTCTQRAITSVQLSANQMFLSAAERGGNVCVWNTNTYEIVYRQKWSNAEVKRSLTAWHPWKENYLIIGTLD